PSGTAQPDIHASFISTNPIHPRSDMPWQYPELPEAASPSSSGQQTRSPSTSPGVGRADRPGAAGAGHEGNLLVVGVPKIIDPGVEGEARDAGHAVEQAERAEHGFVVATTQCIFFLDTEFVVHAQLEAAAEAGGDGGGQPMFGVIEGVEAGVNTGAVVVVLGKGGVAENEIDAVPGAPGDDLEAEGVDIDGVGR